MPPAHIGNFRTFVINDVLRRLFRAGVRRDKGETSATSPMSTTRPSKRARAMRGRQLAEVTQQWTDKFHADCDALNCLRPHVEPTRHRPSSASKSRHDRRAHAQETPRRRWLRVFQVSSFGDYGRLSRVKERELQPGSALAGKSQAVDADERKTAPTSPCGSAQVPTMAPTYRTAVGPRPPGWHIECSAMSKKHLGDTIDLPHRRRGPALPAPRE